MNNNYRYQLEKYRGRSTRYVCPQCGRKQSFTRYIDTYNNNIYINDKVGKCNRLDKCGYHYTPKQYFEDNPWSKRDDVDELMKYIGKFNNSSSSTPPPPPKPQGVVGLPRWVEFLEFFKGESPYTEWLRREFGDKEAEKVIERFHIGACGDYTIFWQVDIENRLRTGKMMLYDNITGHRLKGEHTVDWIHSVLQRDGILPEGWVLQQCLYGEDQLRSRPKAVVAIAEAPKTAHIGTILMPEMVWVAVDSMMGLSEEKLQPLKGRRVLLFPDEGKGYEEWQRRIVAIAENVGFRYEISTFMEHHAKSKGDDIADLVEREEESF